MSEYPKINYIGNKEKIADWIIENLPIKSGVVVDLFCGGCSVSYALKKHGFTVLCNDVLYANYVIARALIENNSETLSREDYSKEADDAALSEEYEKLSFLTDTLYFKDEVKELARLKAISNTLEGYKKDIFLSLIRRAMIRKIPYSRMNIKWEEIVKLRDEQYSYKKYGRYRHYHNVSFTRHIEDNLDKYNSAIINEPSDCKAYNKDALLFLSEFKGKVDLVYLDPPYPSTMNKYDEFYGSFDRAFGREVKPHIDLTDKKTFLDNFIKVIKGCADKADYIAISLNNKCYPSEEELIKHIQPLVEKTEIYTTSHVYQITGKQNKNSNSEILLVCKMKGG